MPVCEVVPYRYVSCGLTEEPSTFTAISVEFCTELTSRAREYGGPLVRGHLSVEDTPADLGDNRCARSSNAGLEPALNTNGAKVRNDVIVRFSVIG